MSPQRAHDALSRIGWLSTRPPEVRERILAASVSRAFPAGTMLYALDDEPGGLSGIAEGVVGVLIAPGPFAPRLVHFGRPGWWVGEAAAATRTRRRAEVWARTDVTAVHLPAAALGRLTAADPGLWAHIAALTVDHLDRALSFAAAVACDDLELRVLGLLDQIVGPWTEDEEVDLPIGQAELAELAGVSRSTMIRVLALLEAQGCIRRGYRSVIVDVRRVRKELQRRESI
jgi:CRP-like cAMP-binding protein